MTLTPINVWLDEMDEVLARAGEPNLHAEFPGWYVHSYYAGLTPCEALLARINADPIFSRADLEMFAILEATVNN